MQVERSFAKRARSWIAAAVIAMASGAALGGSAALADGYFDVDDLQVLNDRDVPEVCFSFSDQLPSVREASLEDYVSIAPAFKASVSPRGSQLCVSGFEFGKRYQVRLLSGLPSKYPEITLDGDRFYDLYMPDRPASIGFRGGNGYILPSALAEGLPLRTVNLDKAELRLIRVNDRNLVQQIARGKVNQSLWEYDVGDLEYLDGEIVWEGTIEVPNAERNKSVDTIVPVRDVMGEIQPGLYVAAAKNPDSTDYWEPIASQWFVISDIGLTTFWADNGLYVYARSLEDAAPLAGVELALLAQNNNELGKVTTDAEGFARFEAGALRGQGGNLPRALLAYGQGSDFNVLDLGGPTLDLVDRGIGGRTLPGTLDAFLYSERGIYRPGETVHLTGILRDDEAKAVAGTPLTFKLWRSDGAEYRSYVGNDQGGGSYALDLDLPGSARTGLWQVTVHLDPKGPAIGQTWFEVEDFVPPQIEFDLTSPTEIAHLEEAIQVSLDAQYLYGAPAADLQGEYSLLLQRASNPFPNLPGYAFGLVQESFTPIASEPVSFFTDADGRATLEAYTDRMPDTTLPLDASVRVAIFDLGGRPVYRRITVPVDLQPYHIGIKPDFGSGGVAEGAVAGFDVVAVDRAGNELAADGLSYVVLREDYDYVWYRSGGRWYSEWVVRESVVETGDLALAPGQPGHIEYRTDWGRYRVEVFDDNSGVASSYRFYGGWWSDPSADRPDEVEVSLDKETYRAGETARVFLKAPYPGKALITVADHEVRWSGTAELTEEGAFVEIPVAEDWTSGVYVLVNAYPTEAATKQQMPRRAVGVGYLALDQASRALTMSIETPEMIRPSQELTVPVRIEGAEAGEQVFMTLAAVDDAVLQLTGYTAPDPLDYFLGKRSLGIAIHDVYGYLIRADGEVIAGLSQGGDMEGRNLESLPERSTKVVSLYSGIVTVGADGLAQVPLAIPDFNGRLRLMSVAWGKLRLGSAEKTMIVRAPLVAEMTLPRFLAPGDVAQVTVALRNLDGAEGDYKIDIATNGVVTLDSNLMQASGLAQGRELRETRLMTANEIGVATITLSVTGPNGYSLVREKKISVRPASPTIDVRQVAQLPAGRSVTVTADVIEGFYPETATAKLSLSSVPDFDVPGLLAALDRYPYGCAEQVVSRALPLLYVNDVATALGIGDDAALSQRVQESIYRLMNMQTGYGAFGLWGPWSEGEVWLTAYVTDFLTRAKEKGYHVPEAGYALALDWLKRSTNGWLDGGRAYAGYAYAQYTLARAGAGNLSDLRYFYETQWQNLPTPVARAQFAAALAWLGDLERARAAFGDLQPPVYDAAVRWRDYGSDLRDQALAVALMADSGAIDDKTLINEADRLARAFASRKYLSTQEMSWLLLATYELVDRAGDLSLTVNGSKLAPQKKPFYAKLDFAAGDERLTVENSGRGPLYQVLTVTGVTTEPLPAEENGFAIRRRIFDLSGVPVALADIKQGDSYIVLIEGRSHDKLEHDALVVDLLPAGFEIENGNLGQGGPLQAYPWLGELSWTLSNDARDDRFAAAVRLNSSRPNFRVAYMVRVVTPGSFTLPGTFVEDMYQPELNARGPAGQITVSGR